MDRIHGAGAEVVAISVDDAARQAGMANRWGLGRFRFVADPAGESVLQPLGLFEPEERGGIALPAMLLVTPDGAEAYRFEGRDYADRTNDDDLWAALDVLALPAVDPPDEVPDAPDEGAVVGHFRPSDARTFFFANSVGGFAVASRLGPDTEAGRVAMEHVSMARATMAAWKEWRGRLG